MPHTRPIQRKLTTILAADAANYSGRMSRDENATIRALRAARSVIDAQIAHHGGRIANTAGDSVIAEFPSVVDAVTCSVCIQAILNAAPDHLPYRLAVHLDDVIIEGNDLLGDGVNLASRLQEMADVGGILVSQQVSDHVRGKLGNITLRPMGPTTPKHLANEVGIYAVVAPGVTQPRLLDNLGPKVDRSVTFEPEPEVESPLPAPAPSEAAVAAREKFKRDRVYLVGGIVALAVVDIGWANNGVWTIIPTIALGVWLYRKWRALRVIETE